MTAFSGVPLWLFYFTSQEARLAFSGAIFHDSIVVARLGLSWHPRTKFLYQEQGSFGWPVLWQYGFPPPVCAGQLACVLILHFVLRLTPPEDNPQILTWFPSVA